MPRVQSPVRTMATPAASRRTENGLVRVIRNEGEMLEAVLAARRQGQQVGLVLTMGALHEGHLSLVDAAVAENDLTVVTVYVNPTQFGPGEDYKAYPRDLDADVAVLASRGCNIVFAPSDEAMYREGHDTFIDVGELSRPWEGTFRPTHFRGVATIVLKLFHIALADRTYFGQKDYQQTLVVKQMVADLNVPIDVRVMPTLREPDGLAMSSRNAYLSAAERKRALSLVESLQLARRLVDGGERNVDVIRRQMTEHIRRVGGVDLQYLAFLAAGTVSEVSTISGPTVVAVAAKVGQTRLIDNMTIG